MCSSPKSSSARPRQRKHVIEPVLSAEEYSAMVQNASICYERSVERRVEKKRLLLEQQATEVDNVARNKPVGKPIFPFLALFTIPIFNKVSQA